MQKGAIFYQSCSSNIFEDPPVHCPANPDHSFCLSCIEQWMDIHPTCPICRGGLGSDKLHVCTEVERELKCLQTKCPSLIAIHSFIMDTSLCAWTGSYTSCRSHIMRECDFHFSSCKYIHRGCPELAIRTRLLSAHESTCEFGRPYRGESFNDKRHGLDVMQGVYTSTISGNACECE